MNKRLLQLVHSSTYELVDLMRQEHGQVLQRTTSTPTFALSCMPTPAHVRRALHGTNMNVRPSAARRPPVPSLHARRRSPPDWRMPPTFQAPPRRSYEAWQPENHRLPPPPAPLDRKYSRGVQQRLDEIQGTRTPLHERLMMSPGYANLPKSRQELLRQLVKAINPSQYNTGNARALQGQSIRDVIATLNLRADSSLRVEMQIYDRELQRSEQADRMRTPGHRQAPTV